MRKTAQRADLEQPHRREFLASNEARMKEGRMPDTLRARLRWYERAWWEETPARLHGRGIWRSDGEIVRGIPTEGGYVGEPMKRERIPGGSVMGTPQDGDAFRRWMEGNPRSQDADGYFDTPLRAAMWTMAVGEKQRSRGRPLIARWLFRVARAGFDWHRAADSASKPHEEAELLTDKGLEILWRLYGEYPSRREVAA